MASLSLFPMFLDPLGGGGAAAGGDNLVLTLDAEPVVTLDPEVVITLDLDG